MTTVVIYFIFVIGSIFFFSDIQQYMDGLGLEEKREEERKGNDVRGEGEGEEEKREVLIGMLNRKAGVWECREKYRRKQSRTKRSTIIGSDSQCQCS